MQKSQMLPCPFCGGDAELVDNNNSKVYYFIPYFIRCKNLCYEDFDDQENILPITDDYNTEKEAIEAWNNRVFDW